MQPGQCLAARAGELDDGCMGQIVNRRREPRCQSRQVALSHYERILPARKADRYHLQAMAEGTLPSLCFPPGLAGTAATKRLSDQAASDLAIDVLQRRFRIPPELLYGVCQDRDVIRYRQDVLADTMASASLRLIFAEVVPMLHELAYYTKTRKEQSSNLQQAVWRLGELETYVACLQRLADAVAAATQTHDEDDDVDTDRKRDGRPLSAGLETLARFVAERQSDPIYLRLQDELPALRGGLKRRASVTIGVNLDAQLRPSEATLLRVHDTRFDDPPLLTRLFGSRGDLPGHVRLQRTSNMAPLLGELERMLGAVARPLARALSQFVRMQVRDLLPLEQEIGFYLGASSLFESLTAAGMPVCRPEIRPRHDRSLRLEGLYNVELVLSGKYPSPVDAIVANDIDMDADGRIVVLTGPNQGGKTTYARAVGTAQVLAQAGLYVPARSAALSPCDVVATHFPNEEGGSLEGGRLAEEAARLAQLFTTASDQSLILLNESLASTSPSESLYLAEDVVRGLRYLGARAIYATHLHELGARVDQVNAQVAGRSDVVSMAAQVDTGHDIEGARRTFRILPGPPVGLSYARDIAERYEISFARLQARIDSGRRSDALPPQDAESG